MKDGQAGAIAGEPQDVIDGAEEFLGLGLGDVMLLGWRQALAARVTGWRAREHRGTSQSSLR